MIEAIIEGGVTMEQSEESPPKEKPNLGSSTPAPEMLEEDDFDLRLPGRLERHAGRIPDEIRVRIVPPTQTTFRRVKAGVLEATAATEVPQGRLGRLLYQTKRFLIGTPLATAQEEQERLSKVRALAILSSDAISSVAFATEAILINLVAGGSANLGLTLPISLAILALLVIVTISYRQTIPAYPAGGGSYIVARENLGTLAGLVAAAALMIDYILNVSVSISAVIQNVASLFSGLTPFVVPMGVALIVIITILNLRGLRESGTIFALPTYFFVGSALLLIVVGALKIVVFHQQPPAAQFAQVNALEPLSLFLILRAFATGCSAMTGVEAISNGIPVFQKPETRNASITLTWMAVILGSLFLGITFLTLTYHVEANQAGNPTVVAQIATSVFTGPLRFLFPVFQLAVLSILTLSAETSYSAFPRLASLLARDKFLPTQFSFKGDRLGFSVGIIVLATLASLLVIGFQGQTTRLINLFAVGVFVSFTLSQAGMVVHWWRLRREKKGWQRSIVINGLGALTTLVVSLIIAVAKFLEGAWIVILLIPLLVLLFRQIKRHYQRVERERTVHLPIHPGDIQHRIIVPIAGLDRASEQSLAYARSLSSHVTAVHVAIEEQEAEAIQAAWHEWQQQQVPEEEDIHLLVIESPYRSLIRPVLAYIDTLHERHPDETLTVILPEYVVSHWWETILHNQAALRLKAALLFRPDIVVINFPHHLHKS
jgi:amino acid transporter